MEFVKSCTSTDIYWDWKVHHSSFVDEEAVDKACGCPLLPLKSHIKGPAPTSDQGLTCIYVECVLKGLNTLHSKTKTCLMQIQLISLMKQSLSFVPMSSSETLISRALLISFLYTWHFTLMWLLSALRVAEL